MVGNAALVLPIVPLDVKQNATSHALQHVSTPVKPIVCTLAKKPAVDVPTSAIPALVCASASVLSSAKLDVRTARTTAAGGVIILAVDPVSPIAPTVVLQTAVVPALPS